MPGENTPQACIKVNGRGGGVVTTRETDGVCVKEGLGAGGDELIKETGPSEGEQAKNVMR